MSIFVDMIKKSTSLPGHRYADQKQDVNGIDYRNAMESTETPVSGTSTDLNIQASIPEVQSQTCDPRLNNVLKFNTSTIPSIHHDRIEFNVHDSIPSFFGREEFLKKLHDHINHLGQERNEERSIRSKAVVVCGIGGVGKTQVVRKYIQVYKQAYEHVLWINAESYTAATSKFLQLAGQISINENQNGKQKPQGLILEEIYDFVCRKSALLIFDNVESFKAINGKDGLYWLIPKYVKPAWKTPAIIVTTRNRSWTGFKIEELQVFDLNESTSFLTSFFRDCNDNRILQQKVVSIFQGLPLALQLVFTFVRNQREACKAHNQEMYTLQMFLADFSYKKKQIMQAELEEYPDWFTLQDMIFEQIGSKNNGKLALQCLDVMAILNPDYIPTDLILSIFSHAEFTLEKALGLLQTYNLVTKCVGYYEMHRMIQAAQMESSRVSCTQLAYVKLNLNQIVDSVTEFVQNLTTNDENLHDMLSNVIRIHDQGNTICTTQFLKFQTILANKLVDIGRHGDSIQIHRKALQSSEQIYHLKTVATKYNLARALYYDGKFEESRKLFYDVLQLRNKILGPNHPLTLATKNNLAGVLESEGNFELARELYDEVLKLHNIRLGPSHPDTVTIKNNLAFVLARQKKFEEAREIYEDVLKLFNEIHGPDHPDTMIIKSNLAFVCGKQSLRSENYNGAR